MRAVTANLIGRERVLLGLGPGSRWAVVVTAVVVAYLVSTLLGVFGTAATAVALVLGTLLPALALAAADLGAFIYYWILLTLTQNACLGLFSHLTGTRTGLLHSESKTVAAAALLIVVPRLVREWRRYTAALIALGALLLVTLLNVRHLNAASVAYARNFLFAPVFLLLLLVATEPLGGRIRLGILHTTIRMTSGLLLVGSCAELLVGRSAWRHLFNTDLIRQLSALSTNTTVFGITVPRTGGFILEAVNAGYIATGALLGVVALAAVRAFRSWVEPVAESVALVLVMLLAGTKSSALSVALLLGLAGLFLVPRFARAGRRPTRVLLSGWTGSLVLTLGYMVALHKKIWPTAFTNPVRLIGGDSTPIHWAGLVLGVSNGARRFPFGNGLGAGGNFQVNADDLKLTPEQWYPVMTRLLRTGAESGIGVLTYQLGLFGLVAIFVVFVMLGRRLKPIALLLLAVWSSTTLLAEASMGPMVAGISLLAVALTQQEDSVIENAVLRPRVGLRAARPGRAA